MSEVNLTELRQYVATVANPYKVVRRDAIEYVGRLVDGSEITAPYEGFGKNVYRVEGSELLVNDTVSRQLDEIIGLTPKHTKVVKNASGEAGVRELRNYFATAGSMLSPVSVALIANPESRTVSGLVPIKEEPISAEAFFDFLELFMEKNNLYPTDYEVAYDIAAGLSISLDSYNPEVHRIAPGEDFLINSYYLRWHLGQIELGRIFTRMICANGQMMTFSQKDARLTSVREDRIDEFLEIPRNAGRLNGDFDRFTRKALEAMGVRASIAELKWVSDKLVNCLVDSQTAMAIAPFADERKKYLEAGYSGSPEQLSTLKASMSVWDLYNAVTDYASNNTTWERRDNRRGMLQTEAIRFLMRERDIKNYSDIFA